MSFLLNSSPRTWTLLTIVLGSHLAHSPTIPPLSRLLSMGRDSSFRRFAVLLLLVLLNGQLPTITSQSSQLRQTSLYPSECLNPCLPPPSVVPETNCPPTSLLPPPPPPSEPSTQPPSDFYPPTDGGYTPHFPPPWYEINAPPPPDPMLPYFPWYYKHPPFGPHSSPSDAESMDIGFVIRVLGFLCSALFLWLVFFSPFPFSWHALHFNVSRSNLRLHVDQLCGSCFDFRSHGFLFKWSVRALTNCPCSNSRAITTSFSLSILWQMFHPKWTIYM